MNSKNALKRKIEQIKKEETKRKFVEDMERKYKLNMLNKHVGLVGA